MAAKTIYRAVYYETSHSVLYSAYVHLGNLCRMKLDHEEWGWRRLHQLEHRRRSPALCPCRLTGITRKGGHPACLPLYFPSISNRKLAGWARANEHSFSLADPQLSLPSDKALPSLLNILSRRLMQRAYSIATQMHLTFNFALCAICFYMYLVGESEEMR
uniref:Uncharacterized protein n=1 Tax=Strigamia maritima TaxID=126957 RepID=T1JIY6_STRMM